MNHCKKLTTFEQAQCTPTQWPDSLKPRHLFDIIEEIT